MALFQQMLAALRWQDAIDITIVSLLIYNVLLWIKGHRANKLLQGIIIILFVYTLSHFFQLYTIEWLMQKIALIVLFIFIIVFQPELRQFLEKLGESTQLKYYLVRNKMDDELISIQFVQNLVRVVEFLADNKIGSLIVVEQLNNLESIKETGVTLNADFSMDLLVSIFYGRNPLHDGAVIIKGSTIISAGCLLPLTQTKLRDRSLGTRHRAALGLAEQTDAIVIITSEETGIISIATSGKLYRKLARKRLQEHLLNYLQLDIQEGQESAPDKFLGFAQELFKGIFKIQ